MQHCTNFLRNSVCTALCFIRFVRDSKMVLYVLWSLVREFPLNHTSWLLLQIQPLPLSSSCQKKNSARFLHSNHEFLVFKQPPLLFVVPESIIYPSFTNAFSTCQPGTGCLYQGHKGVVPRWARRLGFCDVANQRRQWHERQICFRERWRCQPGILSSVLYFKIYKPYWRWLLILQEHVFASSMADLEKTKGDNLPPLRNPPKMECAEDLTNLSHLNEPSGGAYYYEYRCLYEIG